MRRERRGRTAAGTALGALLAAAPVALAGLWGAGHPERVMDLAAGTAWLASPARGLVSLVDASSAQVAVTLRLPVADAAASVVQGDGDGDAYVVRAGTLTRLDAATWAVGTPVAFADERTALTVLPGRAPPDEAAPLWVLDGRTVRAVDPRTLDVRATADLRLGEDVRAVVDERGDLWAADDERVVRVRPDRGGLRVTDRGGTGGDLVLVQGRAVLVDVGTGTLRPLDGARRAACAQTRSDSGDVRVVGSATSPEVYAAAAGTLRVAATDGGTCATVARLGDGEVDVGALAQVGGYVVAPDLGTGLTSVVDPRTGEAQTLALTDPGHRVELVVRGSTVFWNDLDGHASGLLELAGTTWSSTPVDKYDPSTGVAAQVVRAGGRGATRIPAVPAPFQVELTSDRSMYAPGQRALVTPAVGGEVVPGETWRWGVEDLATGLVEEWGSAPPGAAFDISALPDVGEYAVTLDVTRGGATVSAGTTLRVVAWCALVVTTRQVDLAVDPTLVVEVDPDCPVQQEIEVTAEPWLSVTHTGGFRPGSPGVLTLHAVAAPPAAGAVPGALQLAVRDRPDSLVRVDVVGRAP